MRAQLSMLSGYGGKAPAALLLDTERGRVLLDVGGPLEAGLERGWLWPGDRPVDAVVISHDHVDHIGAIDLVPAGTPVYATAPVGAALPDGVTYRELPLNGEIELAGMRIRTGQAGHSLGGVWLHFDIGGGLFYSGDFSLESTLFRFDAPPVAELALLDASYGLYDQPQSQCRAGLLERLNRPTLLPVPASGRALEMALWLEEAGIRWSMDATCRSQLERLKTLPQACFQPGVAGRLAGLGAPVELEQAQVALVGSPEGIGPLIEELMTQGQHQVIYTGYLPPKARGDVERGDADWLRWNVHPRCSDLVRLADQLKARRVVPLFTALEAHEPWRALLGDRLFMPNTPSILLS
ncbi:MBL fold metallo-hydrolase [Marinobacterium marinum]|uniref:MBL fold metallo-hydrolase n=1 Tax=Marinobacterium marinum TaxID=2756129 RepID=A0A7W1WYN6_9GAMM|nr:MBL fold metallo-hydrolase [Marinobacterium marinum]MBA4502636.1 MBL fold metallo-hydrolase [Marinobacterium marinum]